MRTSATGRSRISARLTAALSALALATALTACGGSDSGGSGADGGEGLEVTTVRVASLPAIDTAGLYVGVAAGLFKKEGLDVRVQPVQQSIQALPALANGDVDVISGANFVTFFQAQEKGTLKLRVVSEAARNAPGVVSIRVMPDSKIRSAKDLEGATVGVNILNNIQTLMLNAVLEEQGVDSSKVEYRQIPFPQMGATLEKGQVDAVFPVEPFQTQIERTLKARTVVDLGKPVESVPLSGFVTSEDFATKNPKATAAFQRALLKAQALAADRAQVEKVLPQYAKVDAATAKSLKLPTFPATLEPGTLQELADRMLETGMLKQKLDVAPLLVRSS